MEETGDLYIKLQVYLMKKDNDVGQLRFLTSRTTTENSKNVEEICDSIGAILRSCEIPTNENASKENVKCVNAFKYLTLNTNFESQENLAEDLLHGHLVDMSPPLSPYLLFEILKSLNYDEILAESIIHVPLDLSVELIEISRRCLNTFDFSRGLKFLSLLTLNCYKKLRLIEINGAITTKPDESLEKLMINCQELMSIYFDKNFTRFDEINGIRVSEVHGLLLKSILKLSKDCLDISKNGVVVPTEISKIYEITFGRESYKRMNENFVTQLGMLDQEFVHVLLKKLTDIDVKTYLDWSSLEDSENSSISLQKSLGIDCYNFIEFTKNYENLIKLDRLTDWLRQISSKPDTPENKKFDLDELCKGTINGNKECLKELMTHYQEWNHDTFNIVNKNRSLLDKNDFFNLLEYLTCVMTKDGQEEHKREVFATVTKVLLQLDIKNVYETIIDYILKHDAVNTLESVHTEETFKKFMSRNKNFKSATSLRLVLFFLAKNPTKILSILLKISIGDKNYENVMITPSDLLLLSPIMSIRGKNNETLVVGTLRRVCLENEKWSSRKFTHFVRVMLEEFIIKPDDIVNNVFIPCLNDINVHPDNVRSILNCLRDIVPSCTEAANFQNLVLSLSRRMSYTRYDKKIRKYTINQSIGLMVRVIEISLLKLEESLTESLKMDFIEKLEKSISPIDKYHYSRILLSDMMKKINIADIAMDYERRCVVALTKIDRFNYQRDRMMDDYIRHIMVIATENEYFKLAMEMIIFQRDTFDCDNEYVAYDKILRLTIEACLFSLQFPGSNSPDTLSSLIKAVARFTQALTTIDKNVDVKKIHDSLMKYFQNLKDTIELTSYSSLYTNAIVEINNRDFRQSINDKLRDLLLSMDNFANKCLDLSQDDINFEGEPSNEAKKYKIAHDFLTEITSFDYVDDNNSALCKMYKLLYSDKTLTTVVS